MIPDRTTEICAALLAQRVIERHQFPELDDEPQVVADVRMRLEGCGLTLVERIGIPYVAIVLRQEALADEFINEQGLDRRALALLLRVWLRLVAPHIYTGEAPPTYLSQSTVTLETLLDELRPQWTETILKRYLGKLVHTKFLKYVHRHTHTYAAGPMLWLAIHHEDLIDRLKRAAIPFTIERLRQQQEQQEQQRNEEEEEE